ncbi:MAG TPA: RNA polymerase sigma factor [Polyangiaceae bacterium]|nr:RNA polymerase sigma factor [Polyangiaceae bacterium]
MDTVDSYRIPAAIVEHLPSLRRRARTLCRNEFDAEDLVSDTVTRAITYADKFEYGTNLHAWLQRVQYHCFVSSHRRKKRERAAMLRFVHECQSDEPVLLRESNELSTRVVGAMDQLPPPMKDVVELVDLFDLTYREAAEQLHVPVGTVMSRLFRGRNRLATQLSGPTAPASETCAAAAA